MMHITAITQPMAAEFRKMDNALRKTGRDQKPSAVFSGDKTEFSSNAKNLDGAEMQSKIFLASVEALPDVRMEKIVEVRKKIDNGYYDSAEFVDKLAEKLLEKFQA